MQTQNIRRKKNVSKQWKEHFVVSNKQSSGLDLSYKCYLKVNILTDIITKHKSFNENFLRDSLLFIRFENLIVFKSIL